MPTSASRSWCLSITAVAALVLVTGCRSSGWESPPVNYLPGEETRRPLPPAAPSAVTILVTMGADGLPLADPPTQIIRPNQEVHWASDTEGMTIDAIFFDEESPFRTPPKCAGRSCFSARPSLAGSFKYGITVTTAAGTVDVDPILIIRP